MKKKLILFLIFAVTVFGVYHSVFSMPDKEYKEALLKSSGHSEYTLKNMKPIMGETELVRVLKKYDKHPEKYQTDLYEKDDQLGVEKLTYRAGLHSHTTFSDGSLTPEETLNQAAEYADKVKAKHPFEKYPMIIAITDHFNTQGCIEAIDVIQKNPEKYKNVKFVIGMETEAYVEIPPQEGERAIHILAWCINPYEWPFGNLVFDEAWGNWGVEYQGMVFLHDYKEYIKRIQSLKYGLVSIAHPLRYFDKDDTIDEVMDKLFSEYKELKGTKELFTEGYYQPYRFDVEETTYDKTAETAEKYGIYRTGSQDTHGQSIFKN